MYELFTFSEQTLILMWTLGVLGAVCSVWGFILTVRQNYRPRKRFVPQRREEVIEIQREPIYAMRTQRFTQTEKLGKYR